MKYFLPTLIAATLFAPFFTPLVASAAICASDTDSAATQQGFGDAGTLAHFAAIQFTVASQCDVGTVKVRLSKAGGPADFPAFTIWTNVSSLPGAQLGATTTLAAPLVFSSNSILSGSNTNCLAAGTYWLVLGRTGTVNSSADFQWWGPNTVALSVATYNNSGWAADTGGPDYSFEIDDGGSACVVATAPVINWHLILFGDW